MKKPIVVAKFIISRSALCNGFEGFLGFSDPSIILADLLRNTCLLVRVQKVMVCDMVMVCVCDFDPFCLFCVSRFVAL